MKLAIDIIDGHGLSDKVCHEHLSKKTKYQPQLELGVLPVVITNRTKSFSYKK